MADAFLGFEIKETAGGRWLVTFNGVQWGKGPYDASGCSSETWETREDALSAVREQIAF